MPSLTPLSGEIESTVEQDDGDPKAHEWRERGTEELVGIDIVGQRTGKEPDRQEQNVAGILSIVAMTWHPTASPTVRARPTKICDSLSTLGA